MKKNNEIKDELKKLSPFLSDIKKENAFKVPKDYFKSLPDKVLDQIQVSKNTTEQISAQASWIDRLIENIAVLFQPRYAIGFATALILIVAAIYINQKPVNQLNGSSNLVSQYVEENIDEFDAEMLWEASVFESEENYNDETEDDVGSDEYLEELIDELDDSELEMLL
jgi:hypothetical protein